MLSELGYNEIILRHNRVQTKKPNITFEKSQYYQCDEDNELSKERDMVVSRMIGRKIRGAVVMKTKERSILQSQKGPQFLHC